jgi:hypothetical protein
MEPFILEETYIVGTPFEFMILLDKGRVRLLRDTNQIAEWPLEAEGLHFRVGVVYEAEAPESGDAQVDLRGHDLGTLPHPQVSGGGAES